MALSAKYDPTNVEDKWYQQWMDKGYFNSDPDERDPFVIVIPPPNVTGVLHMGHMLNNTIQDILVRRARMLGKNACWVAGTDHASIATEAKVVNKLKNEGIDKADLTRAEFLEHAWQWKEKHGGIILEQLKKLGASCDWRRTSFTMDPEYYKSVIKVFVDLHNKGLIYRGVRMVNWDPDAQTAVSDEEVNHKEVQSKLYYLKYQIEGENEHVIVATTRPETILGDTAVCINPKDERFSHLKGKSVLVPLINRSIPIIEDEYVDMEFGTGCLKITPAHDIHDYEIGIKHNLPSIDILNDDGTLNKEGAHYAGKDRFEVRKEIAKELEEKGCLEKEEDYTNKVGFSERTNAVIEPKLSMQWFLKMEDISKPALKNVMDDTIKLVPSKFKNTYRHWMENVKDWCISRQLWWGQQIPVYFINNTNDFVVAENIDDALVLAKEQMGDENLTIDQLKQDEDVLDTWFSSWLWPMEVFKGISNPDNEEINYYYPTNDLITGPDILFFWVARMIIAGYEYKGKMPFENVYLTGIVRDSQRRKMSKQLGNSPDPIELMKKYGADGIRMGMLLCSSAGNDLLFDENLPEQGRNFCNKIWNTYRLIDSWEVDQKLEQPETAKLAIQWFESKLNDEINQLNDAFSKYRLSEGLMQLYKLYSDEFSGWFLEMVKPAYQKPIDTKTLEACKGFIERLLQLLHPFMPFITEELWQNIQTRSESDSIMLSQLPKVGSVDQKVLDQVEWTKEVIAGIRNVRNEKNIPQKEALSMFFIENNESLTTYESIVKKLANLTSVQKTAVKDASAASFMVKSSEFFIPLEGLVDAEDELSKLNEELTYTKGFLQSVTKKLSNERFVNNAPQQVVSVERQKQADAEQKIKILEERIAAMG